MHHRSHTRAFLALLVALTGLCASVSSSRLTQAQSGVGLEPTVAAEINNSTAVPVNSLANEPVWLPLIYRSVSTSPSGPGTLYRTTVAPPSSDADFKTGELSLWIPSTTEPLRGVIVYGPGCGASSVANGAPGTERKKLAEKWRLGFVGMHFTDNGKFCSWSKAKEAGEALIAALNDFARQSNRPELAHVPMVLYGMSGGAGYIMNVAFTYPNRTIAAFPRGHLSGSSLAPAGYNIPLMLSIGETDAGVNGMTNYFYKHRPQGPIWSFAKTPGEGHVLGQSWNMAVIFFDAVLEQRLPAQVTNGPVTLKPMDQSRAWLGNNDTKVIAPATSYSGDPLKASWLPNEHVARKWQEFVTTAKVTP